MSPMPTPVVPPAIIAPAVLSKARDAVQLEKSRLEIFQYIRIDVPQLFVRFKRNLETSAILRERLENSVHRPLERMSKPSISHIADWAKARNDVKTLRKAIEAYTTINDRLEFFKHALQDLKNKGNAATPEDIENTIAYLVDNIQPLIDAERTLEQLDELILNTAQAA